MSFVLAGAHSPNETNMSHAALYHELLEAMTVALEHPPSPMVMLNEAGFERAARQAYEEFGPASPENLDRMLQSFGFGQE